MGTNVANISDKKSVLLDMAVRFGMEPAAFEATVRATCLPPDRDGKVASREEFAAFLLVAKEYELNPLLKEIYGFRAKNGAIVPVVSVDGWSNIINSNPALDGIEFDDHLDGKELTAVTCRIWRKDRSKPTVVTEYMSECRRDPDKTPWGRWPRRLLRHKALIQCSRYAFGFSGIVDPDEAERIDESPMRNITPMSTDRDDEPPPPPPRAKAIEHKPEQKQTDVELVESGRDDGSTVEWTDPEPDGLDIPPNLDRREPKKSEPKAESVDEFANWKNDAIGALSGCENEDQLYEVRKKIIDPAKGKVFPPDWQAVAAEYRRTFDRLSVSE